jgi:hydroxypyruvate isomerase
MRHFAFSSHRRDFSMPRFATHLSFLYPELPFLARFEAAARDGFLAVEYLFPHACPPGARRWRVVLWPCI